MKQDLQRAEQPISIINMHAHTKIHVAQCSLDNSSSFFIYVCTGTVGDKCLGSSFLLPFLTRAVYHNFYTTTFQNYHMICRLGYSVVYACRCSAPLSSCKLCFLNMFLEQQHALPIILILIPLML